MNRFLSARPHTGGARLWTAFVLLALVFTYIPVATQTPNVEAHHANIKWPFAGGSTWYISQGYNTSPSEGWSHYNCDPQTLKDAISHSRSCNQYYQYKYSFDLKKLDGNTAGQQVLSPVNGTIRWIDEAFGGMSIDLGDGYAVAFFHAILADGLEAGQQVLQGQVLGTVAPAGQGGNGGTPHLHLTIWQTTDGGNWSRNAVPFTDDHDVDGYDLPALSESTKNQHYQKQIVSTNSVVGAGTGSPPAVPVPTSPAMGTTYQSTGVTPTLTWNAVSGATGYQVVVNNGSMTSPWVTTTSWKMPALATGQYAWQVKARNATGESALSAKWVFWVDPANGGSQTPTPTSSATGTPGPLKVTLDRASAGFGANVLATGSGYNPNETVNIYLDSISTTAIATTTASGNGSFSKSFTMPETTGGNHTIIARGVTSKKQPTAPLKMNSTLARTPYQGPPGTSIAVTVYGFGANETVKLNFDSESGPLLGNATTNAKGTGTVNIKMPESTNGWHDYVGVGQTSNLKAYGALLVERNVSLNPTSGNPGTTVNLTAKGFPARESITVGWNRTATIAGTTVCSGTTTASGNFTCSFTVPQSVAGGYPVMATSSSGANAGATFGVLGPAGITINPTSGAVATNITVSGGGFQANEQVRLTWDSSSTAWFTIHADANGSFLRAATVPKLSTANHTLNAKGLTSNKTTSFAFRVTATGGNNGSSMIAPGTYRVTATIEGLVGHTTSNGHLITPFDHFVALPACTQSSCPWLTPGGSTYVAPCGNNCYVKVLNEATGLCSVAPVYDRGPWFINDNWWETSDKRYLNTRSGAVNYLAQGYVGADAARNGLDVGFGLSNGIGVSDVGYQTGNRAAIDIADGTWVDIGLPQSAGIGTVVVTMLWQTGQSHTAAEAACGQSTPTPTPTPTTSPAVTLSPKGGPVGTKVNVGGTGYGAGETVKVYLDSSSTTALASVKASNAGSFKAQITIPSTSNGDHRIHAVGQTTKKRTAATFTVGSASTPTPTTTATKPSITISPSKGPAGTSVQVTGKGYGKSETVKIYLDTTSSPALASISTSNAGEFTAQIVIPDALGGNHRIHSVGQTSKLRSAKTFQITPTIQASKSSGVARETIAFQVKGFGPNETVGLYWDGLSSAEATATTDANGVASFSGKAPWLNGAHTGVIRGSTSDLEGIVTFTVQAKIKLTPTSGGGTTKIGVRGTGFAPATTVNIFWGSSSSSNLLCSVRTSNTYGTFDCEVNPKAGSAAGKYSIIAIGGGKSAIANFTLTSAVAAQADEPTPEPTATEESSKIEATASPTESVEAVEPTAEATAESTEDPTAEPTEEPTVDPKTEISQEPTGVPTAEPTPEPTPEPVTREIVLTPVSDTSISAVAPDQLQSPEAVGALSAGGENGDVTLLTFNVEGIGAGSVVNATLVLTGSGETGASGGTLHVASGYFVDEASATYLSAPTTDLPPAIRADGSPTTIDWIDPGVEVYLDVTGTVTSDGSVTFVIAGVAEQGLVVGSRESGVPPRLVITIVEAVSPAS